MLASNIMDVSDVGLIIMSRRAELRGSMRNMTDLGGDSNLSPPFSISSIDAQVINSQLKKKQIGLLMQLKHNV